MKTTTVSGLTFLPLLFLLSLISLLPSISAQSTTLPRTTSAAVVTTARPATTTTLAASRTTAAASSSSSAVLGAGVPVTVSFAPVAQATACSALRLTWTIPSSVPRAAANAAILDLWVTNQGIDQDLSATSVSPSTSSDSLAAVTPVTNLNNRALPLLARAVPDADAVMNWNFTYTPAVNLVYNIGSLTLLEGRYYIYATTHATTQQVGRTGVFSVVEGSDTACLAALSSSSSVAAASSTSRGSSTGAASGGGVVTSADAPAGTGASSSGEGANAGSSSNAATIGGAVGGVLGGLALLGLLAFCCVKRRRERRGSWVTPGTKKMFKDPESSGWKEGFSNLGGGAGKNGHKRSSTRSTFFGFGGVGGAGSDGDGLGDKEMAGGRSGDTSVGSTWRRSQDGNRAVSGQGVERSPFAGGSESSHGGHNNFGIALGGDEGADDDEKYGLGRNGVNELGQTGKQYGGERAIELNSLPTMGKSTGSNAPSSQDYHTASTGSQPALSHEYVLPQPSPTHATTFSGIPHLAGYTRRDSPPRETVRSSPPRQARYSGETVSSPSKSYEMHSTPLSPQSGFDATNSNNINMNASAVSDESAVGPPPGSRKVSRSDSSASATLGKMGGNSNPSSPPVTYPGFPHAPVRRGSVKRKPVPSIEGNESLGLGVGGWQAGAAEGEKFYDAYDGAGGEEVLDERQRAEFAQYRNGSIDSNSNSRPQSGYQHNPKRSASQGSLNRMANSSSVPRSREGSVSATPKMNVGSPALSQMGGKRGSFMLMPDRPLSQVD